MVRQAFRMIKKAFGQALKERRMKAKLSQEKLAQESGISLRYLQDLEAGKRQPTLTTLFKLAHGLGTKPQSLITAAWKAWTGSR